jgi:hypothetical protein
MRCDADDLYPEGRIKDQVDWLDDNPEYAAVCGAFSTIDSSGRLVANLTPGETVEDITVELNSGITRTSFCTYALRRKTLRASEVFRPYFVTAEDIDFQLCLGEVAKVMYLPRCFYLYRLHDASITHTQGSLKRTFFETTARQFQMQRKTLGQDDLQRGCPPKPPEVQSDRPGTSSQQIRGMLIGAAWDEHASGNKLNAISLGCRALRKSPYDLELWRSMLALIVKPAIKK